MLMCSQHSESTACMPGWIAGVPNEAAKYVAAFEEDIESTKQQLQQAVHTGSSTEVATAMAAAGRYAHLANFMHELQAKFQQKQRGCEQGVREAVAIKPLRDVMLAVEQALHLGLGQQLVSDLLEQARKRDALAVQALNAAAQASPFEQAQFDSAAEACLRFGLAADVAAAKLALDRRKQHAAVRLKALTQQGGSVQELEALTAQVQGLGVEQFVRDAQIWQQQSAADAAKLLQQCSENGSFVSFETLKDKASKLGLSTQAIMQAETTMQQRQQDATDRLRKVASCGSYTEYRQAYKHASELNCQERADCERRFDQRRLQAADSLASSCQDCCHQITTDAGKDVHILHKCELLLQMIHDWTKHRLSDHHNSSNSSRTDNSNTVSSSNAAVSTSKLGISHSGRLHTDMNCCNTADSLSATVSDYIKSIELSAQHNELQRRVEHVVAAVQECLCLGLQNNVIQALLATLRHCQLEAASGNRMQCSSQLKHYWIK